MNRLVGALPAFQATLSLPGGNSRSIPSNQGDVDALVRAIKRKAVVADMHRAFLGGICWERVDSIGRRSVPTAEPDYLRIRLSEATVIIEHPGALIDHVYVAFDGLTAALVNMTDTLGRLINLAYTLGIDEKGASLFAVRDKCAKTSALGTVLYDTRHTDWLKKVRGLRGRCQHADLEDVLTSETGPYSRRGQPCIDQMYSWTSPPQQTLIVPYAHGAAVAAEDCMLATIAAIAQAPTNPTY